MAEPVDVGVKPPNPTTYLGDGVYASFDGYQVWIHTSNGITMSKPIALEPPVIAALMGFYTRCTTPSKPIVDSLEGH